MSVIERVILIVLDACGVGALPDAAGYDDEGTATLQHTAAAVGGLHMPHAASLGLARLAETGDIRPSPAVLQGSFGRMAERSAGKDSTTGHWEIAGVITTRPFPTYPEGFPLDLVREFERRAGVRTIGNIPASGTEIIERLGPEHLETGALILYTSADSVFQLAAHEEKVPVERLYEVCRIARELLQGEHAVGRVIARPFVGGPGSFVRTERRKDFSLPPPEDTLLDKFSAAGRGVLAIGKITDLFAGRGIDTSIPAHDNEEGMKAVKETARSDTSHALVMANLIDCDQLWGHRRDPRNFARALERFDLRLGELLPLLRPSDLLIVTADHGCDPTYTRHTDHTREYVPLLVYGEAARPGVDLGTRKTFADIAATLEELFSLPRNSHGTSFLQALFP